MLKTVLINTKESAQDFQRYGKLLQENGFRVRIADDPKFSTGQASNQELIDFLKGTSALVAGASQYPREVLENLPELRVIARTGVGFDGIDISSATANDILVTITPNSNYEAVSEHALMLILAIAKSVVNVDRDIRQGLWPNSPKRPIRGSVLGIVGLGRIGKSLALRAQAMKMKVITTESNPDYVFLKKHGVGLVELHSLLKKADYISLHCPLTDETRGVINKETLSLMKPEASIINTARGGLIVEPDLVNALKSGLIAGAGLDVFEKEPTDKTSPLYKLNNVILSPHVAGSDDLSRQHMGLEAANCIISLANGNWPRNAVVNQELKSSWCW